MEEKDKKLAHAKSRHRMAKSLMEYAAQSKGGGEYFLSVNGMRMWVEYDEAVMMLKMLRVCIDMPEESD